MDREIKSKAEARLKRIAGQVAGIQRMLDENRYCVDVLLQVAAIQAALMETARVILGGHVEGCFSDALKSRDARERRKKVEELLDLFSRFYRIEGEQSPADAFGSPHIGSRG